MTFGIFVIWVLMSVLAGLLAGLVIKRGAHGLKRDVTLGLVGGIGVSWLLRAVGVMSGSGLFLSAVVALAGAAIVIVAQRTLRPTAPHDEARADVWWRWTLGAAVVAIMSWMIFGPAQRPAATAAAIDDRTYAITPATMKLNAGILGGEVTDMKVTERIEQGSGRIVSPAKLTGRIVLKNTSPNQTVRVVSGKIQYIDAQGKPIDLEGNRTEPVVKFASSEQLDPGHETTEALDVEFPVAALAANTLKAIRLNLAYVPSPYREQTATLTVSVGAP